MYCKWRGMFLCIALFRADRTSGWPGGWLQSKTIIKKKHCMRYVGSRVHVWTYKRELSMSGVDIILLIKIKRKNCKRNECTINEYEAMSISTTKRCIIQSHVVTRMFREKRKHYVVSHYPAGIYFTRIHTCTLYYLLRLVLVLYSASDWQDNYVASIFGWNMWRKLRCVESDWSGISMAAVQWNWMCVGGGGVNRQCEWELCLLGVLPTQYNIFRNCICCID